MRPDVGEIRFDAPLVSGLLQGRPGLAGRRRRRKRQHEAVIGRGGKRCGGEAKHGGEEREFCFHEVFDYQG